MARTVLEPSTLSDPLSSDNSSAEQPYARVRPSQAANLQPLTKTAGSSLQVIFRKWFGDLYHEHYQGHAGVSRDLPTKIALSGRPIVLYGHFNEALGFGIRDYYPDVDQFLTVMRDSFARVVSDYFYNVGMDIPVPNLADFVLSYPKNQGGILNYFPFPVTRENYKDLTEQYFVDIGITEMLNETVSRFARKLGKPCPESVPTANISSYTKAPPEHLRDAFRDRNPLDHDVYDYVASRQRDVASPKPSGQSRFP